MQTARPLLSWTGAVGIIRFELTFLLNEAAVMFVFHLFEFSQEICIFFLCSMEAKRAILIRDWQESSRDGGRGHDVGKFWL